MLAIKAIRTLVFLTLIISSLEVIVIKNPGSKEKRALSPSLNPLNYTFSKKESYGRIIEVIITFESNLNEKVSLIQFVNPKTILTFEEKEWNLENSNSIKISATLTDEDVREAFEGAQEMSFLLQVTLENDIYEYSQGQFPQINLVLSRKSDDITFEGLIDIMEDGLPFGKAYEKVQVITNLQDLSYEVISKDDWSVSDRQKIISELNLQPHLEKMVIIVIYNLTNSIVYITDNILIYNEKGLNLRMLRSAFYVREDIEQKMTVFVEQKNLAEHHLKYIKKIKLIKHGNERITIDFADPIMESNGVLNTSKRFLILDDYEGNYYFSFNFAGKKLSLQDQFVVYITNNPRQIYTITNLNSCNYIKEEVRFKVAEALKNISITLYLEQNDTKTKLDMLSYEHLVRKAGFAVNIGEAKLYVYEGDDREQALEEYNLYYSNITLDQSYKFESKYQPWIFKNIRFLNVGCDLSKKPIYLVDNRVNNSLEFPDTNLNCKFFSGNSSLFCDWLPMKNFKGEFTIKIKDFIIDQIVIYIEAKVEPIFDFPFEETNPNVNELKVQFEDSKYYSWLFFITISEQEENVEKYYQEPSFCQTPYLDYYIYVPPPDEKILIELQFQENVIYNIKQVVYFDYTLKNNLEEYPFGYLFYLPQKYVFIKSKEIILEFLINDTDKLNEYSKNIYFKDSSGSKRKLNCEISNENQLKCELPKNLEVSNGTIGIDQKLISSQRVYFVDFLITKNCVILNNPFIVYEPQYLELITPLDTDPIVYPLLLPLKSSTPINEKKEGLKFIYLYDITNLLEIGENRFNVSFNNNPQQDIVGLLIYREQEISFGPPNKRIIYITNPNEEFSMKINPAVEICDQILSIVLKRQVTKEKINIAKISPCSLGSTIDVHINMVYLDSIMPIGVYDIDYGDYCITKDNIPTGQSIMILYNYATKIELPAKHIINELGYPTTHTIYYQYKVTIATPKRVVFRRKANSQIVEFGLVRTDNDYAMQFVIQANLPIVPEEYEVLTDYGNGNIQLESLFFSFFLYPIIINPSRSFVPTNTTKQIHILNLEQVVTQSQINRISLIRPTKLIDNTLPLRPSSYNYEETTIDIYTLDISQIVINIDFLINFDSKFENSTYKIKVKEFGTQDYSVYTYIVVNPTLDKGKIELKCGGLAQLGENHCHITSVENKYNLNKIELAVFVKEDLIHHTKENVYFCKKNSTLSICQNNGVLYFEILPENILHMVINYSDSMLFKYRYTLIRIEEDTGNDQNAYTTYTAEDGHIFQDYWQFKEFFYLPKEGLERLTNVQFDIISTERLNILETIHFTIGNRIINKTANCSQIDENSTIISCDFDFDEPIYEASDIRLYFTNETSEKYLHLIRGELVNDRCQIYNFLEDIEFDIIAINELLNFSVYLNDEDISTNQHYSISQYKNGRYKIKIKKDYFTNENIEYFTFSLGSLILENNITLTDEYFRLIDTYISSYSGSLTAQLIEIQTLILTFSNLDEKIRGFYIVQNDFKFTPDCRNITESKISKSLYECDFNLSEVITIGNYSGFFTIDGCPNDLPYPNPIPINPPTREIIDINPKNESLAYILNQEPKIQFKITYKYKLLQSDIPDSITLEYNGYTYITNPIILYPLPSNDIYFEVDKREIEPGNYLVSTNYTNGDVIIIRGKRVLLYLNEIKFREPYSEVWEREKMMGLIRYLEKEVLFEQIKSVNIDYIPNEASNSSAQTFDINSFYLFRGDYLHFYNDITYEYGIYNITITDFKEDITFHKLVVKGNIHLYDVDLEITYPKPARENNYNEIIVKGNSYNFLQINSLKFKDQNGIIVEYSRSTIIFNQQENYFSLNVYLNKDEQLQLIEITDTFNDTANVEQKKIILRGYKIGKDLFIADKSIQFNTFTITLDFYDNVTRENIKDSIMFNGLIQSGCTPKDNSIISCDYTTESEFPEDIIITIFEDDRAPRLVQFVTYTISNNLCQYTNMPFTDIILSIIMKSNRGIDFTAIYEIGNETNKVTGNYIDEYIYDIPIQLTKLDDSYNTTIKLSNSAYREDIVDLKAISLKAIRETAIDALPDEKFFFYTDSTAQNDRVTLEIHFTIRINYHDIQEILLIQDENITNEIHLKDCSFGVGYEGYVNYCKFTPNFEGKYYVTYIDGCGIKKDINEDIYIYIGKTKNILEGITPVSSQINANVAFRAFYKMKLNDSNVVPTSIKLFHKKNGRESTNKVLIDINSYEGDSLDFSITNAPEDKELGLFRIKSEFNDKDYNELSPFHILIYENELKLVEKKKQFLLGDTINEVRIEFVHLIFYEQIGRINLVEEKTNTIAYKISNFTLQTTDGDLGKVIIVNLGGITLTTTYIIQIIDRADFSKNLNFTLTINENDFYSFDVKTNLYFLKKKSNTQPENMKIQIIFNNNVIALNNYNNFYIIKPTEPTSTSLLATDSSTEYVKIPCELTNEVEVTCNYTATHPNLPEELYLSLGKVNVEIAKRKLIVSHYRFSPQGFEQEDFLYVLTLWEMEFYLNDVKLEVVEYSNGQAPYSYTLDYKTAQTQILTEGIFPLYAKKKFILNGEKDYGIVQINNEVYVTERPKKFSKMVIENGNILKAGNIADEYILISFTEALYEGEVKAIQLARDNLKYESSQCTLMPKDPFTVRCAINLEYAYSGEYVLYYINHMNNVFYLYPIVEVSSAFEIEELSQNIFDITIEMTLKIKSNHNDLETHQFKGVRLVGLAMTSEILPVSISGYYMTLHLPANKIEYPGEYYIQSVFSVSSKDTIHNLKILAFDGRAFTFKFEQLYFKQGITKFPIKITFISNNSLQIEKIYYNNQALTCTANQCYGEFTYVSGVNGFTYKIKGYSLKFSMKEKIQFISDLTAFYKISTISSCVYYKAPDSIQITSINGAGTEIINLNVLYFGIYNNKNQSEVYLYSQISHEEYALQLEENEYMKLIGEEFTFVIFESKVTNYLYQQKDKIIFTDLTLPVSIASNDNKITFTEAFCELKNFDFLLKGRDEDNEQIIIQFSDINYNNGNLEMTLSKEITHFIEYKEYDVYIKGIFIGIIVTSNSLIKADIKVSIQPNPSNTQYTIITIIGNDYYLERINQIEIDGVKQKFTFVKNKNEITIEYNSCVIEPILTLFDSVSGTTRSILLDKDSGAYEMVFSLKQSYYIFKAGFFPQTIEFGVEFGKDFKASELKIDGQKADCFVTSILDTNCTITVSKSTTLYVTYGSSTCFGKKIQIMTYNPKFSTCYIDKIINLKEKEFNVEMEIPSSVNNNDFSLTLEGEDPIKFDELLTTLDYYKNKYTFSIKNPGEYDLSLEIKQEGYTKKISTLNIKVYNPLEISNILGELKQWSKEQTLNFILNKIVEEGLEEYIPETIYLKNGGKEAKSNSCNVTSNYSFICIFDLSDIPEGSYSLVYIDKCQALQTYEKPIIVSRINKLIEVSGIGYKNIPKEFTFTYEKQINNTIIGIRINGQDIQLSSKNDNFITATILINTVGKFPIYTKYGENKYILEEIELIVTNEPFEPILTKNKTQIYQFEKLAELTIHFEVQIDVNLIESIICQNVQFLNFYIDDKNLFIRIPNNFTFNLLQNYIIEISFIEPQKKLNYIVEVIKFNIENYIPIQQFLYIRSKVGPMTIEIYSPLVTNLFIKSDLRFKSLLSDGNGTFYYTTSNLNEEIILGFSMDNGITIYEYNKPIYLVDNIDRIFTLTMSNCWYVNQPFPSMNVKSGFNLDINDYKFGFILDGKEYENIGGLSQGSYIFSIQNNSTVLYQEKLILTELSLYSPYSTIENNIGRVYLNSLCNLGSDNIYIGDIESPLSCTYDDSKSIYDCTYPSSLLGSNDHPNIYFNDILIGSITIIPDFNDVIFKVNPPDIIKKIKNNKFQITSIYDMSFITKVVFVNQDGFKYMYCFANCIYVFSVYSSKIDIELDFTKDTELYLKEIHNLEGKVRFFEDILFKPEEIAITFDSYFIFSSTNDALSVKLITDPPSSITINSVKLSDKTIISTSGVICSSGVTCKIKLKNPSTYYDNIKESQYLYFIINGKEIESRNKIQILTVDDIPSLKYKYYFLSIESTTVKATFTNSNIKYLYQYGLINAIITLADNSISTSCSILGNNETDLFMHCPKAYLSVGSIVTITINNIEETLIIQGFCEAFNTPIVDSSEKYTCQPCKDFYLNGVCFSQCPETFYQYDGKCVPSCRSVSMVTQGNTCVPKCEESKGYGLDGKGEGFNICIICADYNLALLNGVCTSTCPSGYEVKNGKCSPIKECIPGYCKNGACLMYNSRPICSCDNYYYGNLCQLAAEQLPNEMNLIEKFLEENPDLANLADPAFNSDINLFLSMLLNDDTILSKDEVVMPALINALEKSIGFIDDENEYTILSSIMILLQSYLKRKTDENRRLSENDKKIMEFLDLYQQMRLKKALNENKTECEKEEDLFNNFALYICPSSDVSKLKFDFKWSDINKNNLRRLDSDYTTIDISECVEQSSTSKNLSSTFIGIEEIKSEKLRQLVQRDNNIDKFYFFVYDSENSKMDIEKCNNIKITAPFSGNITIENNNKNYFDYFKEKNINVYNKSDPIFTELCYINNNLDFDLSQKFRQDLYNKSQDTLIKELGQSISSKCTPENYNLGDTKLTLVCSLSGDEKTEENEQDEESGKSIISGKKNLVFKCQNHVGSLAHNVAFILFLIIILLGIGSIIFVWLIEYYHKFNINPKNQADNDNLRPKLNSQYFGTEEQLKNLKFREKDIINESTRVGVTFSFDNTLSIFKNNIFKIHPILSLTNQSIILPMSLNICFFIFSFFSLFGFNAIFFNESYIHKRISSNNRKNFAYPFKHEFGKIILSIILSMLLKVTAKALSIITFEEKNELKRKVATNPTSNLVKIFDDFSKKLKILLRRISALAFMLGFTIFLFYYSVVFCAIYRNAQSGWASSGFWSLFFDMIIFAPLYILVISFLQKKFGEENRMIWYMKRLFCF